METMQSCMKKLFISTHTMKKKVYLHTIKNLINFNTFLIYFGQKKYNGLNW